MARGKHSAYTDSLGRFHTKALFVETISKELLAKGIKPIYSLNGDPAYIDIHEMFINSNDPTGYTFAIAAFDSWEHLKHLKSLEWFKRHYNRWEEELEIKMRSGAIRSLVHVAENDGSRGITAAKYIADKGWEKKRGRPSNSEVERERKIQATIKSELEDDFNRLHTH
jgi:hypothetical protein